MRKRLHAVLIGLVALLGVGLVAPAPAGAITGGTVDTANKYSNVGIIAFYDATGRYRCTATLVTPTVLLTAAHCTQGTLGKTIVNFNPFIDDAPPSSLPRAADDTGDGLSKTGYGTMTGPWYSGTAYTHPQYSDFTDMKNWNDVGVVVLDKAVAGITPARLAPRNRLDTYAQPALNKTLFTVVGYGTEVRQATEGPQKPTPQSYPIVRRYTDVVGQKLTPQILQVNGNEHDPRGGGGSCFGDSGGPTFDRAGYLVTVTSYGYTSNCRYIDGLQRVDIKVAQDWLATFGVKPAA
ncbi:pterin-4-alpha-carbinolamine dehydratase [Blastococcus sp. TF02-8]|uniref:S1 family peptidase n=1 Tax=Blastococcus sp. TF02-8 TaxID=2250574 RepID=UPI000DE93EF9|nr:trypsin-like serine protease [Blastococcus sp. TF02-8]RBY95087.1 pterin-4-alpha-carbinolamine dehydratase [Blastococcus sp. TF02-8]